MDVVYCSFIVPFQESLVGLVRGLTILDEPVTYSLSKPLDVESIGDYEESTLLFRGWRTLFPVPFRRVSLQG